MTEAEEKRLADVSRQAYNLRGCIQDVDLALRALSECDAETGAHICMTFGSFTLRKSVGISIPDTVARAGMSDALKCIRAEAWSQLSAMDMKTLLGE